MVTWRGEDSAYFWRRVLTLTNVLLIGTLIFMAFWIQALKNDIARNIDETKINRLIGCQNQANTYAVVVQGQPLSAECMRVLKQSFD